MNKPERIELPPSDEQIERYGQGAIPPPEYDYFANDGRHSKIYPFVIRNRGGRTVGFTASEASAQSAVRQLNETGFVEFDYADR